MNANAVRHGDSEDPVRHGDVPLWPVPRQDVTKLRLLQGGRAGTTLTTGSATGHEHAVQGAGVEVYEEPSGSRIIRVPESAELVHAGAAARHKPVLLPAGDYRQSIKRQESPEGGWENVQD